MNSESTCPHCGAATSDDTRFPGSSWCKRCVDETLAQQDAEARDHRVRPQVFGT